MAKPTSLHYLLVYPEYPSLAAAAILHRAWPETSHLIPPCSTERLTEVLQALKLRRGDTLHLVGHGPSTTPNSRAERLRLLAQQGIEIHWYCAGTYLESFRTRDDLPPIHWHVQTNTSLTRLTQKACGLDDEHVRSLTRKSEVGDANEPLRQLAHAAVIEYLKFDNPDAVTTALQVIAGMQTLGPAERQLIARSQDMSDKFLAGRSSQMMNLRARINTAGEDAHARVLITGETGVGKEVVANLIHERSPRAGKPFKAINCAAIPADLLESLLFGYEKGAFTGAVQASDGLIVAADQGTLFLDEIGEMSPALQAKLLRFLQEGTVQRIGASIPRPVDVRVLSATNINLREAIDTGKFRADLFYRLNVIPIHVPPLRERASDIPQLARHILWRLAASRNTDPPTLSAKELDLLMAHSWEGNVRQLENVLERKIVLRDVPMADLLALDPAPNGPSNPTTPVVTLDQAIRSHVLATYNAQGRNLSKTSRVLGIALNTTKKYLPQS